MKRILIVGAHSYIGTSFAAYVKQRNPDWKISAISVRDQSWKKHDFSVYDVVFYVAGKVHMDVSHVVEKVRLEYYRVNCNLACIVAEAAKKAGVKQFIYLSTASIYGDSAPIGKQKKITKRTRPHPNNVYGESKWKAEQELRHRETEKFRVAILRIPMVYGPGCKGNYPTLEKLAVHLPIFPNLSNKKSMIYVETLSEFLCQLIEREDRGIFFPQNKEYVCTSELVRMIAETKGKKIRCWSVLNPFVWLLSRLPGKFGSMAKKAFGNFVYDQSLSTYQDDSYRELSFRETIQRTSGQKE
ncbi:MAG: NAD-dependent epimerase/dehydratase family protein [Lachnospiraceae bacterium]